MQETSTKGSPTLAMETMSFTIKVDWLLGNGGSPAYIPRHVYFMITFFGLIVTVMPIGCSGLDVGVVNPDIRPSASVAVATTTATTRRLVVRRSSTGGATSVAAASGVAMLVRKTVTATVGSTRVMECDVTNPAPTRVYVEQIITWRKHGTEVPIFIQFNGFPPHIDAGFQGRVRLADRASIEIRDIGVTDEGWYECSIVFLDGGGSDRNSINGTRIYLAVNVAPTLAKTSPKVVSVKDGTLASLYCEGQGRPQPEVTWFKDGTDHMVLATPPEVFQGNLSHDGGAPDVHSRGMSLARVSSVIRPTEPGLYTCLMKNLAGHVTFNISLYVEGRAYIKVPPKNTTVRERTPVTMHCHADGYPGNMTYQWYLDGVNVHHVDDEDDYHDLTHHGHDDDYIDDRKISTPHHIDVDSGPSLSARVLIYPDGTLYIADVRRTDAGWYTCRAANGPNGQPTEAEAYLNVTYLPTHLPRAGLVTSSNAGSGPPVPGSTSILTAETVSVGSGSSSSTVRQVLYLPRGLLGRIECPVDANPPVTLTVWSKNDRVLDLTKSTRFNVNARGTLVIKPVATGDDGQYSCTPYSSLGAGSTSSPVDVIVRDPPYFTVRPKLFYQSELGHSVVLPCAVKGEPTPYVIWRKVDGLLPPIPRSRRDEGNLTLIDIRREDHGKYECVASNVVTTVISSTFVVVELTSSHAAYNVTVEPTSNSARVSWYPAYDGGNPHHYVIWYRVDADSNAEWQTIRVVPNDTYSLTVHRLWPQTSYQFLVMSRDKFGREQFSQTISITTLPLSVAEVAISGVGSKSGATSAAQPGGLIIQQAKNPGAGGYPSTSAIIDQAPSDSIQPDMEQLNEIRRPPPPFNVSVKQQKTGLLLTWLPPPLPSRHWPPGADSGVGGGLSIPMSSAIQQRVANADTVRAYLIQYRTVGQWVDLTPDRLPADKTWYEWKTASRGATYQFRVLSLGADGQYSLPSPTLTFHTGDPMPVGDGNISESLLAIVGGSVAALALLAVIIGSTCRICRRARRRHQRMKRDACLQRETVKFYHTPNTDTNERISSKGTSVTMLETQTLSAVDVIV